MTDTFRRPREDGDDGGIPPEFAVITDPDEAIAWLEENGADLSDDQRQLVVEWLFSQTTANSPVWSPVYDAAQNLLQSEGAGVEGEDVEDFEADEEATQTLDEYYTEWQETQVGPVPKRNLIDIAAANGAANPEQTVENFIAAQTAEDEEDGEGGEQLPITTTLPEWVLQRILTETGSVSTPEIEQRIVEYWNLYKGGEFESIDQVAPLLADANSSNQIIVGAAALDDTPDQGWTVQVPGGNDITISGRLATNLFENFGFDLPGLNRMARMVGMSGEDVLPYSNPQDNLLLVASLMSALNQTDELSEAEEMETAERLVSQYVAGKKKAAAVRRPRDVGFFASEEDPDTAGPGVNFDVVATVSGRGPQVGIDLVRANWDQMSGAQRRALQQYISQLPSDQQRLWRQADLAEGFPTEADVKRLTAPGDPRRFQGGGTSWGGGGAMAPQEGQGVAGMAGRWYPGGATQAGVLMAQERLRQGWEKYQDIGLAMVHAIDPGLASRIQDTGGDPAKLTPEDDLKLRDVINRTNGSQAESWLDLVEGSPLAVFNSLSANQAGGGGGGAGRIRRVLDPVQVKTQFADLFNGLLLMEPSEELQNQLLGELQGQLDSAEEGMNFDASARILNFVRGTARYQELYGNMPGGQTEEEYLGQFLGGAQSMLGAENAPTGALEAGLRTGKYQSTIGAIAGDKQSFQNSRFLGRLAEVAKVVSQQT